jgi:hypothetical protein
MNRFARQRILAWWPSASRYLSAVSSLTDSSKRAGIGAGESLSPLPRARSGAVAVCVWAGERADWMGEIRDASRRVRQAVSHSLSVNLVRAPGRSAFSAAACAALSSRSTCPAAISLRMASLCARARSSSAASRRMHESLA